jgi:hypothetical protein
MARRSSGVVLGVLKMRFLLGRQFVREENAGCPAGFALAAMGTCDLFRAEVVAEKMSAIAFEFIHLVRTPAPPVAASFNPHVCFLLNRRARLAGWPSFTFLSASSRQDAEI